MELAVKIPLISGLCLIFNPVLTTKMDSSYSLRGVKVLGVSSPLGFFGRTGHGSGLVGTALLEELGLGL